MEDRTILETLAYFPEYAGQLQRWVNDLVKGKELRLMQYDTAEYLVKLAYIQGTEVDKLRIKDYWRLVRKDKINCRLVDFYSGRQDTIHRIYKITGDRVNLDKIEDRLDEYLKTIANPSAGAFLEAIKAELGYRYEEYGTYINSYDSEVDDHIDCEFYIK